MNFSNERYKVGHAAILTKQITSTTTKFEDVTIEAWAGGDGVIKRTWWAWRTKHYVMGIKKIERKWKRWWWRKVETPVPNPGALADQGLTHEGKEYVHWTQFATAKWAAPNRYTCTTLIWWCSKKAYSINLSNWLSPLVTPSDLYLDPNSYVRGIIQ